MCTHEEVSTSKREQTQIGDTNSSEQDRSVTVGFSEDNKHIKESEHSAVQWDTESDVKKESEAEHAVDQAVGQDGSQGM